MQLHMHIMNLISSKLSANTIHSVSNEYKIDIYIYMRYKIINVLCLENLWRVWNNICIYKLRREWTITNIAPGNVTQNLIYIGFFFCLQYLKVKNKKVLSNYSNALSQLTIFSWLELIEKIRNDNIRYPIYFNSL